MDSSETTKLLKELVGCVGYTLLKCRLRNVKLKIDAEKKLVTIIKDESTFSVSFDEIEQFLTDISQ